MEPNSSNPFLIKIILVLIVLFSLNTVLGVIEYSLTFKKSPRVVLQPTPKPTVEPTIIPTPSVSPKIDTSNWKTYRNEKYSFELSFPPTWKNYIVKTKELEIIDIGKYDSINFGFTVQDSLFNINVFTKDQWDKVVSAEIDSGRPKPDYITKNQKFVFHLGAAQYTENQEMADRMSEIGDIISTFKSTEK